MKKIILLLLLISSKISFAQISNSISTSTETDKDLPVKWQVANTINNKNNSITITATIKKGWHIFSSNAGGDGFLIPTTIQLANVNPTDTSVINISDSQANKKPIHGKIEGIGEINYYEDSVKYIYTLPVSNKRNKVKINYQCCNDKMCMPPRDEEYYLQN